MEKKLLSRIYTGLAVLFALCLPAGSFFDLQIAQTLYIENSTAANAVSFGTFYLFFGSCMFFLGALFRQLINFRRRVYIKLFIAAAFGYLFLSTASLGGGEILNSPMLLPLWNNIPANLLNCLLAGSLLFAPWFMAGIIINGDKHNKQTIRSITKLVVIMTLVFFMSAYFNTVIIRPHYRLTVTDPALTFSPWYKLSNTGTVLISIDDLISAHPGSFICGHVAYAVVFTIVFPSYALVASSLKGKEKLLTITALLTIIPIILSRMISGDNYLSDIALGALSAIKICFSFNALSDKSKRSFITRLFDRSIEQKA